MKLKVYNANCSKDTSINIHVKADHSFFVPTAFTPNDDNLNEGFIPKGVGIDPVSFSMTIFNRWGEKVYETTDMNLPWKGTKANGTDTCPEGVYAWLIIYSDMDGKSYRQEGVVTLMK